MTTPNPQTDRWNGIVQRWLRPWTQTVRAMGTTSQSVATALSAPSRSDEEAAGVPGGSVDRAAEELRIGDTVTYSKQLTDADVRAFARASGDANPLHLVGAYARESRFGERIVHGILVAGVISAALAELPGIIVYLSQDLRFLGPVSIGDRVTAECEVLEPLGDDRYRLHTHVETADGETVLDGEAVVLIDDEPTGAGTTEPNTYQSRYRTGSMSAALRSLRTAAVPTMSRSSTTRTDEPVTAAVDRQHRALDLARRAVELQMDLPRRFGRAVLAETAQARSTRAETEAMVRDLTRLAIRTPMTAWSSSSRAAETEVEIDELVERSFEPFEDLWAAGWTLAEDGLDAQVAAYEALMTAARETGTRPERTD